MMKNCILMFLTWPLFEILIFLHHKTFCQLGTTEDPSKVLVWYVLRVMSWNLSGMNTTVPRDMNGIRNVHICC